MNLSMEGLLGGFDSFINPQAPKGAGYDNDTARMARAALLGNMGASLLAAGQGGGPPGSRAAALGTLGRGPEAAAEITRQGVNGQYVKAQTQQMQQASADRQASDAYYRQGLMPGAAAPAGVPAPAAAAPAPGPGVLAAPAGAAPGPVAQAAASAPVKGTWWGDLGLDIGSAQRIAAMPYEQRTSTIKELITRQAERREKYDIVEAGDGSKSRVWLDGRSQPLSGPDINKKQIPGGVMPAQADVEGKLRNEFYQQSKDFTDRQTAYMTMRDLAAKGEGGSDMALVISLMKVYDPTSTVTGGESATAQNSAGVPDGIRAMYNNLTGGGKLSDGARQQLLTAAEQRYGQEYDTFGKRVDYYTDLSKQYGVEPRRVVQDTRDKDFGAKREAVRLSPDKIMGASLEQLNALPIEAMNPAQRAAVQARINQLRGR